MITRSEFIVSRRALGEESQEFRDFSLSRDLMHSSSPTMGVASFVFGPEMARLADAAASLPSGAGFSYAGAGAVPAYDLLGAKSSDLDASLRELSALSTAARAGVLDEAALREAFPLLGIRDGGVVVDISSADSAALLKALNALGLQNGVAMGNLVSGLLPIAALAALESLDGLVFARASQMITHVGSVTNQADPALQADVARGVFGVDGSGQTIGVLSDSFNNLNGYNSDKNTNDLPAGITVLDDIASGGSDEGRAMLQIIHDIAPGADLQFHTAFDGLAAFAQGILDLAAAGSTIIVDDVGYLNNPMFQDGLTAQAVDTVRGDGVLYFSSAGNQADQSYESAFVDSGFVLSGSTHKLHDFDPGAGTDVALGFALPPGGSIRITFQWDQPWQSISGGQGTQNDLDIFIGDPVLGQIVEIGGEDNIGGDALETISFTNPYSDTAFFDFLIGHFSGAFAGFMKFIDFSSDAVWLEFAVDKSTAFGHNNAEGALSIGAASYHQTPEYGQNPALPEDFSSLGGTRILFDENGLRLANPDFRQNVDFTAVDNGDTTFFIAGYDPDNNGFPNFSGTSAAAPAAAAVAALIAEATGANASAIEQALFTTALNMGAAGFDRLTGWGLIQADDAIAALLPTGDDDDVIRGGSAVQPRPNNNGINDINPGGPIANDVIKTGKGKDLVGAGGGKDRVDGGTGNDTLHGEDGADTLAGGAGADQLRGGAGADWADYSKALDKVVASLLTPAGNTGDAAGDSYNQIENLLGSRKADRLTGNDVANTIDGGKGADVITGGKGKDELIGGVGADTITGGKGADEFVLDNIATAGADSFQDFKPDDTIVLDGSVFGLPTGALAAGRFALGNSAGDANDRLIYNSASGKLFFDADGTGAQAQVLIATLTNGFALAASDFVVI